MLLYLHSIDISSHRPTTHNSTPHAPNHKPQTHTSTPGPPNLMEHATLRETPGLHLHADLPHRAGTARDFCLQRDRSGDAVNVLVLAGCCTSSYRQTNTFFRQQFFPALSLFRALLSTVPSARALRLQWRHSDDMLQLRCILAQAPENVRL